MTLPNIILANYIAHVIVGNYIGQLRYTILNYRTLLQAGFKIYCGPLTLPLAIKKIFLIPVMVNLAFDLIFSFRQKNVEFLR